MPSKTIVAAVALLSVAVHGLPVIPDQVRVHVQTASSLETES
jgi:hypothetical protein